MSVRFMVDSTEGKDGACETIMDFVVSWTLRRAQNECAGEVGKENLFKYSRRFLGLLIQHEIKDEDIVQVETWKQENRIDLWVYATVNGVCHDILIEDKYYTGLRDNQLERYKEIFDNWLVKYRNNSIPHYVVLTCRSQGDTSMYEGHGFNVYAWEDMIEAMAGTCETLEPSGSDIFDEFWINW